MLLPIQYVSSCLENPYHNFNVWANDIVFHYAGIEFFSNIVYTYSNESIGYYVNCYIRNFIAALGIYWGAASVWHIFIYYLYFDTLFAKKNRKPPSIETIIEQRFTAQYSLFFDAALPVVADYLIENNLTRVYYSIDEIGGWKMYTCYTLTYFTMVEVGVYWVHRTLHTNKLLYKFIHAPHHKYNKIDTLTPWASIAFHPLDGILQASPYVFYLFFIPVHYFTFIGLLFITGVWATNIHDAVPLNSEPIMGAKYHTIHHTHYHYNFGQYFTFCDWIWGTLKPSINNKD
jgi:Delta7-sterol 5-desaturase